MRISRSMPAPPERPSRTIALSLALAAFAGPVAGASTISVPDARITSVTVYADRAEVVREASVTLPAGASSVEFPAVPFRVEPDSLRVSATGVPGTLGAVEIRDRVEQPEETPEWIATREAVRDLEARLAALDEEEKNSRKLEGFLDSVAAVTAQKQARELAEGRADPATIDGVYELLRSKLGSLSTEGLERRQRREHLGKELEIARAKLATLRPAADIRSRVATVEVEAARAGSMTLRLAYLVAGASWRPAYRASLDPDAGEVHLVSEAVVRQATGEDWTGVELRLSTAAPARGVEPPMLQPWLVRPVEEAAGGVARIESERASTDRFYQNVLAQAPGVADEVAPAEAGVVRSAFNVAFAVPGRADVASDERDHRLTLRQEALDAEVLHRSVPGLAARAYLTAKTEAPENYPLLAGPVRVFAGGAYLGAFRLQETGPGAELTIPFGVDNRIKVTRVARPRETSREGFAGKYREIAYGYRTVIENLAGRAVSLIVEDRVPVSQDERVDVDLGKATTEDYKESERRPGVMLWQLELAPREKREVVVEFTVRFPRDLLVPGLD